VTAGTFSEHPALYKGRMLPDTAAPNEESSMPDNNDPNEDKIEKFEVTDGKEPGTYELYIKTKSEEFDFLIDGDSLQKLGDQIYAAIDKNEGKT
jgi:hypothetical protein